MENSIKNKLVLSSTSQARIDLLKQFNINFETYAPNIDETPLKNEFPKNLVKRLSLLKAQEALKKKKDCFIIAADTVVYARKKYIVKTESKNQAYKNLKLLSGRRHTVFTGLTTINKTKKSLFYLTTTKIKFKKLNENDIDFYLKTNEWKNRAGSYAIQGLGASFVHFLSGSLSSAIGLPMEKVYDFLKHNRLII